MQRPATPARSPRSPASHLGLTLACAAALVALGCGKGPILIDARRDAAAPGADAGPGRDAGPPVDGGGVDAGLDGGIDGGGCVPPTLPVWVPADTGGPAGEGVLACASRVGAMTDARLPADQSYDVTTFGGPGDEQPVACAGEPDADGTWYYAANSQRFSCGQRVRLVDEARTRCAVVQVADLGPNICVEEAGERPIWDVSPLAAQHLFGVSSVGWSEHRAVRGAPVDRDNPLGPCDAQLAASPLAGFIGGGCAGAGDCSFAGSMCLTAGWPGGHCTQDCATGCPDLDGAYAYTACATVDGVNRCLARCDFTLFDAGCRAGYECVARPPTSGSGADRWVCLPSECG